VVAILQRRYVELEKLAKEQPFQAPVKLSTDIKVERGLAPDAGFAESEEPAAHETPTKGHLDVVAAAQQEGTALSELGLKLGGTLSIEDTLSLLSVRVKHLVAHDSMAVYVLRNKVLIPEFVSGENFRLFSSLRIPIGEGLSGWVVQNCKPILNGNPSVEPGYLNDPSRFSTLRSALAVPLEGAAGVVAVLALYRVRADAFSRDDLGVLQAVGAKLGMTIEDALRRSGTITVAASAASAGGD